MEVGVGTAGAVDSRAMYPDGSVTEAEFLGGGLYGFVAFDKPGDGDIFVHVIDSAAHLVSVPVFAFWVAGVVITPTQRSAVLIVLEDSRREVAVATLREGESIEGYRLTAVEPERVLLQQAGAQYSVPVGRPQPNGAPPVNARARPGPIFIPDPDKPIPDVPYTHPEGRRGGEIGVSAAAPSDASSGDAPDPEALEKFLGRVFNHPLVEQKLQEMRPAIQQSLERARQDGQGSPAPLR